MTIKYRIYGGPITSTNEVGITLQVWHNDTDHIIRKDTEARRQNINFDTEYTFRYVGEKISFQARSRDILSELEDVP